jgi:predicted membrane metal-binding protein
MSCSKLIFLAVIIASPYFFGRSSVRRITFQLHNLCLHQFEGPRIGLLTHELGGALVCGKSLSPGPLKNLFTDLGLYHILVVSGAHLTWVTAILMFLFKKTPKSLFLILVLFTFMTNAQPPVFRALLEQGLQSSKLPSWGQQLLAVFGSLAFQPRWIHSRSLFLSALARQSIQKNQTALQRTFQIQLILWPLLIDFSNPSLLAVLSAAIFSAVLETLLFPLLLLVFLFPEIPFGAEVPLQIFVDLLKELQQFLPNHQDPYFSHLALAPWIYWLMAFALLLKLEIHRRRSWYFDGRS